MSSFLFFFFCCSLCSEPALDWKKHLAEPVSASAKSIEAGRLKELKEMLVTLHRYHLLTAAEVEQKKKLIEKLQRQLFGDQG